MAGDWIKMRVWISRDPKTIAIADYLAANRNVIQWLTDPVRQNCEDSCYEHVTRNVMVSVTVAALLQFWGVANDLGKPDGDDLVLDHANASTVDEIAGVPGFGEAMLKVEWLRQEAGCLLRLPKFLKNNIPAEDRQKAANAERQRRYRENQALLNGENSNVTEPLRVTSQSNAREENNTEEKRKNQNQNNNKRGTAASDPKPVVVVPDPNSHIQEERNEATNPHTVPSTEGQPGAEELQALLEQRGLTEYVAKKHVSSTDPGLIREACAYYDEQHLAGNLKKPPAALRGMLKDPERWNFTRTDTGWARPTQGPEKKTFSEKLQEAKKSIQKRS